MSARRVHLVGIGGAGMSGLARLAVDAGYGVSGTDRSDSSTIADLREAGVDARAGHGGVSLDGVDALVVSTAIAADNPDLREAGRCGVPVIHRSEFLAELMESHRGLAVAGAHGKSTTSGMLVMALGNPSACVGATIPGGRGTGAVWGDPPWFVAEADESDRSLLNLRPEAAILLNVDHDHHTTYADIDEVMEVFARFVAALPKDGVLVVGPDPRARAVAAHAVCAVREVRRDGDAFCRVTIGDGGAAVHIAGEEPVALRLAVPGAHNVENAACALTLAHWCGVPTSTAAERLGAFTGVGRRYELRATVGDVTIVDDYAHHPAEIAATLAAARERHDGRVLVVFQPHLYSRTKALLSETAEALSAADVVVVTEIYPAREAFDPTIGGRDVVAAMGDGNAVFAATLDEAAVAAAERIEPGDLVLTLGAGDITTLGQDLARRLRTGS